MIRTWSQAWEAGAAQAANRLPPRRGYVEFAVPRLPSLLDRPFPPRSRHRNRVCVSGDDKGRGNDYRARRLKRGNTSARHSRATPEYGKQQGVEVSVADDALVRTTSRARSWGQESSAAVAIAREHWYRDKLKSERVE
jgi:hypothetical protein